MFFILLGFFASTSFRTIYAPPVAPKEVENIAIGDFWKALGKSHFSNAVYSIRKQMKVEPTAYYGSPITGRVFYHNWKGHGLSLTFNKSKLSTIYFYSQGHDGFTGYKGALPFELTFASDAATVRKKLGDPEEVVVGRSDEKGMTIDNTEYLYPKKGISVAFSTGENPEKMKATIAYIAMHKPVK
jgi:hypothetical protein